MHELFVICGTDDIEDSQPKGFVLMKLDEDGESAPWPIIITRKGNTFFGDENKCPHQGERLEANPGQCMDESDNFLTCGHHRAQFDLDGGLCFIGPCQGRKLPPLNLIIDEGDVCIAGVALADE
jgi:nitrite reductase/ring-hydroxylating ferredoxin subunit